MKTNHFLLFFVFGLMAFAACNKTKNQPLDSKNFASPVWTYDFSEPPNFISAPVPAIDKDDNSYYINQTAAGLTRILSLDKAGKKRFEVINDLQWPTNASGTLILNDNGIYFYCGITVFCYNKNTGAEKWHYKKESEGNSINDLLVFNHSVFLTYSDDAGIGLQKLDDQGNSIWKIFIANYSVNLGMAATGDKLILINKYYYAYQFDMLALSTTDGTVLWKFDPNVQEIGNDPVVDSKGNVYISTGEGHLFAIDGSNGSLRWSYARKANATASRFISSTGLTVLSNDDVIYSANDTLFCFDTNGHKVWSGGFWASVLTLGDNNILYGWYNGNNDESSAEVSLCAINATDGSLIVVDSTTIGTDLKYSASPVAMNHKGELITCGFQNIYDFGSMSNHLEENGWSKLGKGYENSNAR